ncbi:NAD-dependent epimerase/dehydratase family protein [Neosynechococcus sphagnicola]|uniref:NAD-dependent epimerase/dehydratase family protein n=1 Tax=Neosynechococcus sphagnicola TaxID=1501145 RepID=UPI0023BA7001|nr:NAD-dependent epimerase/dehydratase family protein [Neosynechococcus sphagnicola]
MQSLPLEIVHGDLNDPDLWQPMQGCELLFHVAAHYSLWQADRERLYHSNVLGTRNILAAARRAGIERTVYTSSVAAIGVGPAATPVDETYQSPMEKLVGYYKQSKVFSGTGGATSSSHRAGSGNCQPEYPHWCLGY